MNIITKRLVDFIAMIKNNEPFSFSRYWDGEIACIIGRKGTNCDGCSYTLELQKALINTILNEKPYYHAIFFPDNHPGTVNLRRTFETWMKTYAPNFKWYDALIFQRAVESGVLHVFINALRDRNCVLVGGDHLRPMAPIIRAEHYLNIPSVDAFLQIDRIKTLMLDLYNYENTVYLICAGMATNCIIDDLYDIMPNATMIDVGSSFDAFIGLKTRIWIRNIPEDILRKDRHGCMD